MEWPPEILSVVWEHARVAIRPMLKRRLWRDVHFELIARINPDVLSDALCDCRGEGCMICDEDFRPHGGPLAMYNDIAGCPICDREIGWGRPTDCPEHFHWLSDSFHP